MIQPTGRQGLFLPSAARAAENRAAGSAMRLIHESRLPKKTPDPEDRGSIHPKVPSLV